YLVAAGVVTAALWRPVRRVEVVGDSMLPALRPGDRLLVLRPAWARPGDVVAVTDPRLPTRTMVKRVAARGPEGVTVLGDNAAASTDSRQLGPLAPATIRGRAFYRYFPTGRRGRVVALK
ncbi:MAG TPA: nickel-type superoxide dismutase maturation protease, partial [Acidimicrobiales bacterium]|nr:nickel-type superoxide dismutase maturation protease [Acidimicrobiales bacterium]